VRLYNSPMMGLKTTSLQGNNFITFQGWDGLSLHNMIAQFTLEVINLVSLIQLHTLLWKVWI
jgi:hypothetical protein